MAVDFLLLCSKGDSKTAFNKYSHQNFKHHNAYFQGDANTLISAMEENAIQMPLKIFEIQRSLEDGDLVAVHSRVRMSPVDNDIAVIHIFRFQNNKIVELWDFGQEAPDDLVNENGMF